MCIVWKLRSVTLSWEYRYPKQSLLMKLFYVANFFFKFKKKFSNLGGIQWEKEKDKIFTSDYQTGWCLSFISLVGSHNSLLPKRNLLTSASLIFKIWNITTVRCDLLILKSGDASLLIVTLHKNVFLCI